MCETVLFRDPLRGTVPSVRGETSLPTGLKPLRQDQIRVALHVEEPATDIHSTLRRIDSFQCSAAHVLVVAIHYELPLDLP